jgi:hypothetical protein
MRKRTLREHWTDDEELDPANVDHKLPRENSGESWAESGSDMDMDWEVLVRVKREGMEAELKRERRILRRGE